MNSKERYQILFNKINQYNSGEKGITRIAYSKEEQSCTYNFMRMCKAEGLHIRMDQCGNVIARRGGSIKGLPPVIMGSHLDTVYQGGKYDGVVGVTAALEVMKRLNEKGIKTDHPIEIISFACEESARFGVSTIGSKAMAGLFDKEKYRFLKDRDGIPMDKALSLCALDFNSIDQASRVNEKIKAFFELHVEQGPVLINKEKKVGIVTGIAAPVRLIIKISGTASHSGSTPMNMRKDAFLGASEIALALEKVAIKEQHYGTVATVGVVDIHSGAMNVVPGEVEIKVDIRSTSLSSRQRVLDHLYQTIQTIRRNRKLKIMSNEISVEEPVLLSTEINDVIQSICERKNLPYNFMPSGAGHDAMNMRKLCPTGLIFVPSVDGLSHHPDEYTELDDILIGIDLLEETILHFAKNNTKLA
ncbi:Zn-dependent hydrolase [Schinkia azotoformans]|uniref:Zn-dependent hydrolase n=1 Tax=Schinkia azotoformans TaxID=1454 RepID=UPI002DB59A5D|nr:Zn-dependent hydrolase [Schinkia azotoformans]MEC1717297.1 Zn-dependent hydrolase [Schinkia azotoformans]MEC1739323.1 Zn-dependent hydrolase [Schinkia azotoformans]MEC1747665.1 Zn-dependent hydrolase [Schinkia azotoformans]MEC1760192.1 Zn-dependent hydrolase [Schinkia azotoformans]MEC1764974.1 Zn-dependent hydrolase [Schinkia azotoformans]